MGSVTPAAGGRPQLTIQWARAHSTNLPSSLLGGSPGARGRCAVRPSRQDAAQYSPEYVPGGRIPRIARGLGESWNPARRTERRPARGLPRERHASCREARSDRSGTDTGFRRRGPAGSGSRVRHGRHRSRRGEGVATSFPALACRRSTPRRSRTGESPLKTSRQPRTASAKQERSPGSTTSRR